MNYSLLQKNINSLCVSALLSLALFKPASAQLSETTTPAKSRFVFTENKGQFRDQHGAPRKDLDCKIASEGVHLFIGAGHMHYQWFKTNGTQPLSIEDRLFPHKKRTNLTRNYEGYRMDVILLGANTQAKLIKENNSGYYERFYLPDNGREGTVASSYERMTYRNIYPNIDWVLYTKGGQVEYDFVIRPGGRVSDIKLQYLGANELAIKPDGAIQATNLMGSVLEQAPYSYQEDGAVVASNFLLKNNIVSFVVAPHNGILTIDPTLVWGTYFYGESISGDYEGTTGLIGAGKSKDIYISGFTESINNIATTGAFSATVAGLSDLYLVRYSSDGQRKWGTYYGGYKTDMFESSLVSDSLGNVYLAGTTQSDSNIATPGSFKSVYPGGFFPSNFLAKFDSTGKRIWATYYGGGKGESVPYLATDGNNVYMASSTQSTEYIASAGSHQPLRNVSGMNVPYLVKFTNEGVRQWATYYGGMNTLNSYLSNIKCDSLGNVYIAGNTSVGGMGDITLSGAPGTHQPAFGGGNSDAFLAKFTSSGKLIWDTYYGGDGEDYNDDLYCDNQGNVFMSGFTSSTGNIATPSAHQSMFGGGYYDAYLVKFDSSGKRQWGSYFGGKGWDGGEAIVGDGGDNVYLVGWTASDSGLTTTPTFQSQFGGSRTGLEAFYGDNFMAKFNSAGERVWSTYYGGKDIDWINEAIYDPSGYVFMAGSSGSSNGITTAGSHQSNFPATFAASFMRLNMVSTISKFCVTADPLIGTLAGPDTICAASELTYTFPQQPEAEAYIWTLPEGWFGQSDSNSININSGTEGGLLSVRVARCGDTSTTHNLAVFVAPKDQPEIIVNNFELLTTRNYSSYQWILNDTIIPRATAATYNVTENGHYRVITHTALGCVDTSKIYEVTNYTSLNEAYVHPDQIWVFPNPAQQWLHVQAPLPVQLKLYRIDGKQLLHAKGTKMLDLTSLPAGIYQLTVQTLDGRVLKVQKVSKWAN